MIENNLDSNYKKRSGQSELLDKPHPTVNLSVENLMNIRRKAMSLTAEINRILGIERKEDLKIPNS